MTRKLWWMLLFGVCLAGGPALGADEGPAGPGPTEDVILGMSAAFRGPSRGLSIELYRGSTAYLSHINDAGGIFGRKIVVKPYNDNYDPIPALSNTIRLVEQDKAFLLFDYMGTATVTRVLPLLKKYKDSQHSMYLFFPFTGAQPHRQYPYNEFVFNLRASYHQETACLVDHFVSIGRKRIAVFYQIDGFGRSGWDGVRRTLADYDAQGRHITANSSVGEKDRLQIVAEATFRRGTTFAESMTRQVEILRAGKPDAIVSVGTYAGCAALIRDARDAGWDVPIANLSGVDSENLLALLIETGRANGKDYTQNLINSQVVPSYHDTTLPAVRQYRELMDKYHPQPPAELLDEPYRAPPYSSISFEGFLNAKVLVNMLERMGKSPRRDRIQPTVESMQDLDLGIDVPVTFRVDKHQGLDKVYCTVASEGRFIPLSDEGWKRWHP
jgi:branched-chain amino acid transport system substrate-binding protein